jgi:hypothetical protein
VKTTPNPRATKNRRGELVAEPEPLPLLLVVVAAVLAAEVVVEFIFLFAFLRKIYTVMDEGNEW